MRNGELGKGNKNLGEAKELLQELADKGSIQAMYLLGMGITLRSIALISYFLGKILRNSYRTYEEVEKAVQLISQAVFSRYLPAIVEISRYHSSL